MAGSKRRATFIKSCVFNGVQDPCRWVSHATCSAKRGIYHDDKSVKTTARRTAVSKCMPNPLE
jgi:hypothetical protein